MLYELTLYYISLLRAAARPRVELEAPRVSYPRPRAGFEILAAEGAWDAALYRSSMASLLLPAGLARGMVGDEPAPEEVALLGTPRVLLSKELERLLTGAAEEEGGGGGG